MEKQMTSQFRGPILVFWCLSSSESCHLPAKPGWLLTPRSQPLWDARKVYVRGRERAEQQWDPLQYGFLERTGKQDFSVWLLLSLLLREQGRFRHFPGEHCSSELPTLRLLNFHCAGQTKCWADTAGMGFTPCWAPGLGEHLTAATSPGPPTACCHLATTGHPSSQCSTWASTGGPTDGFVHTNRLRCFPVMSPDYNSGCQTVMKPPFPLGQALRCCLSSSTTNYPLCQSIHPNVCKWWNSWSPAKS